ncbi:exopolysaccharide biosynthesis protein [Roseovarius rhodophyticola]|uniref:Exopolysaccharide biosynthesis protein n=1 Tax=Roseovarius rhodophyticola TaxID=3080827 RepID=A0ABZ2TES9_9RHOB|nr:exopolysaccharide biosynthesis protein [Roseovarius sp. W115]MDV2928430.1 exopolysaccharide biosynthesis protein [Roseovarius sp. W115]
MTKVEIAKTLLARQPGRRLSEVLRDLVTGEGGRVSVGDIVRALRDRSFAPLMVIFAAPNVFLFIPGSSVFTALPLMLLGMQLLLGRCEVWLPRLVAERSIEPSVFRRIVTVSLPYVERIERMAKPRWWPKSYLAAERVIGGATLILAVFLFLPIPFANGLPALSIVMLALGLSERDGYWFSAGLVLALISCGLVIGILSVGAFAFLELFR